MYRIIARYHPGIATFNGGDPGRGRWRVVECYNYKHIGATLPIGCFAPPNVELYCVSLRPLQIGSFCNPHKLLKEVQTARRSATKQRVA